MDQRALGVLDFWWRAGPAKWFGGGPAFDAEVRERLAGLQAEAAAGRLEDWAETSPGALARILLLDQVPRHIFRGTAEAFASDARALAAAEAAVAAGLDRAYPVEARSFFYLPFMHAEDLAAQLWSADLFRRLGQRENYFYALVHLDAIQRFGRFPHRNAVLGRTTTPAEQAYLDSGGFVG